MIPKYLGAIRDEYDSRDYKWEDVMGVSDMPSFEKGYDVEERYGLLEDHPQGSAYDCVGEGTTQDISMSIKVKINQNIILSARDIYSQIYLPSGGSSPRNAYKLANQKGVCEDRFLPTRPNGQVLTESFARKRDDLLPNPVYWKIGNYYSINSQNLQSLAQAIYQNNGCGGAYFPDAGGMGHFIFFRGYGMYNGNKALKYRDSYSPFTKWMYIKGGDYFLQDGTPVDLAGLWTFEPSDAWPVYEKKEITCEQVRLAWLKRDDLKKTYPWQNKFYNIDNSGETLYDWAQKYLYKEMPELFKEPLDWSSVDMNQYPEYKFIQVEEKKETLIEKILLWLKSLLKL